jgi:hypothetical protein
MQRAVEVGCEVSESRLLLLARHSECSPAAGNAVIYLSSAIVERDVIESVVVLFIAQDVDS